MAPEARGRPTAGKDPLGLLALPCIEHELASAPHMTGADAGSPDRRSADALDYFAGGAEANEEATLDAIEIHNARSDEPQGP